MMPPFNNPQRLIFPLILILAVVPITLKNLPIGGWLLFFCGHIYIIIIASLILTALNNRVFLTLHEMGLARAVLGFAGGQTSVARHGYYCRRGAHNASDSLGLERCNSPEIHTYGARFRLRASNARRFEIFPDGCPAANGRPGDV